MYIKEKIRVEIFLLRHNFTLDDAHVRYAKKVSKNPL